MFRGASSRSHEQLEVVADELLPATLGDAINDSAGLTMFVFDADLRFLAAAGGDLDRHDLPPAELIGRSVPETFPAWAWERLESPYRAALDGYVRTTLVPDPDGTRWFSVQTQPVPGPEPKGLAIATTLGARQHATVWPALQEAVVAADAIDLGDSAFEVAFANSPVGMAVVDLTGRLLRVNAALCTFLGRPPGELIGESFHSITDHQAIDGDTIGRLVCGELPSVTLERRYRHRTGQHVTAQLSVSVMRSPAGSPQAFFAQMVDITAQKSHEAELQRLATRDALTGVLNRRALVGVITDAVGARCGAVLHLDIDGFRSVNDGFGHAAGDRMLQAVAERLQECTDPGDVVARMDGDDFVVVLPSAAPQDAASIAAELCAWVRTTQVVVDGATTISPTVSIGVVAIDETAADADAVLLAADIALFDAKRRGGNQPVVYGTEHASGARDSNDLKWLTELRRALTEHRFELYAQAIVDLQTGEPVKHEALLRLRGEDDELIPPGAFMPAAERLGLMRDLDEWVVTEAAAVAAEYPDAVIGINLSGSSVGDPTLGTRIEQILFATDCDPSHLVFEITETEAIGNMDQAQALLEHLHGLGCRFALDDFGAGYASFSHLKRLPVEFVKIDGQFIRELPSCEDDQLIVSAIHDVARRMGRKVVAEMIEDAESADLLREMGVDYGQGYYFARPAPIDDVLGGAASR